MLTRLGAGRIAGSKASHRPVAGVAFPGGSWDVALVESVDANGDGLLCSKQHKPNQGQDKQWIGPEDIGVTDYVVTMVNDNSPKGQGS